ncbi:MAG: hypothetical protein IT359_05400 [Gemmatimonadaceae bacterium]|nr:hypothetical protein [Gemmatimonadaceae bacterium]
MTSDARRRIHFAAYRLKYSRWMHVVVVATERVEPLVRSLLASFAASGGVPLRVVFDNPKTVVVRRDGARIVWNPTLAQVVLDYGFREASASSSAPRAVPIRRGRWRIWWVS